MREKRIVEFRISNDKFTFTEYKIEYLKPETFLNIISLLSLCSVAAPIMIVVMLCKKFTG